MQSILKRLLSLVLPLTVLVIVPFSVEDRFVVVLDVEFVIGSILAAFGLAVLTITATTLFRFGNGTIAPWSPTTKLVVNGLYSYVRNPMITGVMTTLLGETLILHSISIFTWFIIFFVINNIYFALSEEPGLVKRFGEDYLEYKRNVPRWIPRLRPWRFNGKVTTEKKPDSTLK